MKAVLVVLTNPANEAAEDAYNDWYTNVHVPDVLAVPGYVSATRYRAFDGWQVFDQKYLSIYELEVRDLAHLQEVSDEHMRRIANNEMRRSPDNVMDRNTMRALYYAETGPRHTGPHMQSGMLNSVFMAYSSPSSSEREQEFHEWYENTHLPEILALPGFLAAQRFSATSINMVNQPWVTEHGYLAIYEHSASDLDTYNASFATVVAGIRSGNIHMSDALTANNPATAYQRISATIVAS